MDRVKPITAQFIEKLAAEPELPSYEDLCGELTGWFFSVTQKTTAGAEERMLLTRVARALLHDIAPRMKDPDTAQLLILGLICYVPQSRELADALVEEVCAPQDQPVAQSGHHQPDLRQHSLLILGLAQYFHQLCADAPAARSLALLLKVCCCATPAPLGAAWRGVLGNCFTLPDPAQRDAVLRHAFTTWLDTSEETATAFQQAAADMHLDALAVEVINAQLAGWNERDIPLIGAPLRAETFSRPYPGALTPHRWPMRVAPQPRPGSLPRAGGENERVQAVVDGASDTGSGIPRDATGSPAAVDPSAPPEAAPESAHCGFDKPATH